MKGDPYKNPERAKRALRNASPERAGEFLAYLAAKAKNPKTRERYWGVHHAAWETLINSPFDKWRTAKKSSQTKKTSEIVKRKLGVK